MGLTAYLAMVRKDLLLFFNDRRSVIVSFAVPILIGAFIGSLTNGMGGSEAPRIRLVLVDEDNSRISKAIVAGAQADRNLNVTLATAAEARDRVQKGANAVGAIIPAGFGDSAAAALFRGAESKPQLTVFFDPSRTIELAMVQGVLTQDVMQALSEAAGVRRPQLPFSLTAEAVTARQNAPYNGYAHAFAGMGIQFLLFAALNLGIELLLERQRGLWSRVRSAPISRYALLVARATSATLISLMTLLVSFGAAMILFNVRIQGSIAGFLMVAVACSMMAATFGLVVAAVGKTPGTARGVSSMVVLVMVMIGGAWVPTFLFPKWMQQLTVIVPVRWAVDGLDATTWRGLPLSSAIAPTLVLLGFVALFGAIAVARFRWDEA